MTNLVNSLNYLFDLPSVGIAIEDMPTKLTPAEQKLAEAMLLALEYAQQHPNHWHDIGPYDLDKAAVEKLRARGAVEVDGTKYRLKREGK